VDEWRHPPPPRSARPARFPPPGLADADGGVRAAAGPCPQHRGLCPACVAPARVCVCGRDQNTRTTWWDAYLVSGFYPNVATECTPDCRPLRYAVSVYWIMQTMMAVGCVLVGVRWWGG
jgi:hypothetical protein